MVALATERVLDVRHWNDSLFSFRTTRDASRRFENGHFVMLGLPVDGKPLLRAYSIASANYEDHLEFFSIKVANGPLTSRLQHLKPGDDVIISRKPTGTLLLHDLLPGKHLYLFSTGTGLAPFLSIIRDPHTYERFDKIVLVHGVRQVSDLAYHDYEGIALDLDERERLVANLGGKNHFMLRNHGTLTVGHTVAAAYVRMFFLERACQMQIAAQSGGAELNLLSKAMQERVHRQVTTGSAGVGERDWPALLRLLDRADPSYKN